MTDNTGQVTVNQIFKQLNDKANLLYKFAMLYGNYAVEGQDYGTGDMINMVAVHTLTAIEENPGITITELAAMWNRTKGAISQIATKLEKRGFIERRKEPGNGKHVFLFPTDKGVQLSNCHKRYDAIVTSKTMDDLMKAGCTESEIDAFFKVIEKYNELL